MYQDFFNFQYAPFSIAPDPRFLFMSAQHKEALAHLVYGIQSSGAFVVLSGEVGSGKTTVCRCFLDQVPENVDIAFILNPKLSAQELLASICDEFSIPYQDLESTKRLVDSINIFLLENHGKGRNTVVIIEEAQNLSIDVLEQLRLLTNLETNEKKLLQIVLLAQPEFLTILKNHEMRQLEQRITARFHLDALNQKETIQYLHHRLVVAGAKQDPFPDSIKKAIYRASAGVPRIINLIADRCLLGAYASNKQVVNKSILKQAIKELKGEERNAVFEGKFLLTKRLIIIVISGMILTSSFNYFFYNDQRNPRFSNTWLGNPIGEGFESSHQTDSSAKEKNRHLPYSEVSTFSFNDIMALNDEEGFSARSDFSEAVRVLSDLWGIRYQEPILVNGPNSLCIYAAQHNLECFTEQGNIGLLLKLGRPAILKFIGNEGRSYYGVLLGLNGDRLLIQFSNQLASLGFNDLEKIWLGEFFLLAKMPQAWKGKILQEGDDSALSLWVNIALDKIDNIASERQFSKTQTPVYGREQVEKLKSIQRKAGIHADGKVGIKTIIFMNSLIDSSVPRLEGVFSQQAKKEQFEDSKFLSTQGSY